MKAVLAQAVNCCVFVTSHPQIIQHMHHGIIPYKFWLLGRSSWSSPTKDELHDQSVSRNGALIVRLGLSHFLRLWNRSVSLLNKCLLQTQALFAHENLVSLVVWPDDGIKSYHAVWPDLAKIYHYGYFLRPILAILSLPSSHTVPKAIFTW